MYSILRKTSNASIIFIPWIYFSVPVFFQKLIFNGAFVECKSLLFMQILAFIHINYHLGHYPSRSQLSHYESNDTGQLNSWTGNHRTHGSRHSTAVLHKDLLIPYRFAISTITSRHCLPNQKKIWYSFVDNEILSQSRSVIFKVSSFSGGRTVHWHAVLLAQNFKHATLNKAWPIANRLLLTKISAISNCSADTACHRVQSPLISHLSTIAPFWHSKSTTAGKLFFTAAWRQPAPSLVLHETEKNIYCQEQRHFKCRACWK